MPPLGGGGGNQSAATSPPGSRPNTLEKKQVRAASLTNHQHPPNAHSMARHSQQRSLLSASSSNGGLLRHHHYRQQPRAGNGRQVAPLRGATSLLQQSAADSSTLVDADGFQKDRAGKDDILRDERERGHVGGKKGIDADDENRCLLDRFDCEKLLLAADAAVTQNGEHGPLSVGGSNERMMAASRMFVRPVGPRGGEDTGRSPSPSRPSGTTSDQTSGSAAARGIENHFLSRVYWFADDETDSCGEPPRAGQEYEDEENEEEERNSRASSTLTCCLSRPASSLAQRRAEGQGRCYIGPLVAPTGGYVGGQTNSSFSSSSASGSHNQAGGKHSLPRRPANRNSAPGDDSLEVVEEAFLLKDIK